MPTKSLTLFIPDVAPFDQQETWFETFIGTHILPLTERGAFRRFWFSRYQAVGHDKHLCFRFETDNLNAIAADIERLRAEFQRNEYIDFDVVADLGTGDKSRFRGRNSRRPTERDRGELAFNFLHATAQLFLHSLSGPDENGRWSLERETESGYSQEASMEQFHHLFCNLTGVPTFVAVSSHPKHSLQILSRLSLIQLHNGDQQWSALPLIRVHF
jgi:hypothetical protein